MVEGALPLNKHGQPKPRTAQQLRRNLRLLGTELSSFASTCHTLEQLVDQIESYDADQQSKEDQRIASIQPVRITHGKNKGMWYCSEADDDLVCRGGPKHGGRFGFAPTFEKKKVTRHIKTQHKPRTTKDTYRSLGDWVE
jgi:hypothetical protein